MPKITKSGHYHGDIKDAYGLDIEGGDVTDSIYLSKAKADKHLAKSGSVPTYVGGTQTFITFPDETAARDFLSSIFATFLDQTISFSGLSGPDNAASDHPCDLGSLKTAGACDFNSA